MSSMMHIYGTGGINRIHYVWYVAGSGFGFPSYSSTACDTFDITVYY